MWRGKFRRAGRLLASARSNESWHRHAVAIHRTFFDLGFDRFFSGHNISVHYLGQHSGKSEAQNLILQSDTACRF